MQGLFGGLEGLVQRDWFQPPGRPGPLGGAGEGEDQLSEQAGDCNHGGFGTLACRGGGIGRASCRERV